MVGEIRLLRSTLTNGCVWSLLTIFRLAAGAIGHYLCGLIRMIVIHRFEVYDAGIAAPIWSDDVGEGTEDGWHVMELTNLTFEPGKTYHFALRQAGEEGHANPADRARFGVYSAEEVAPVSAALEAAGLTGHEANLETLRFFADQSGNRKFEGAYLLFGLCTRVLFSMPASAERSTYINAIVNTYCKPSSWRDF